MGKKKRKELKPWCWYCDREFEDDKVLINHQRAKHFKCNYCSRRLTTAGGLVIHCQTVHKEDLRILPNCIPGRETTEIEIFGMEGVPYDDLQRHIREKESQVQKKPKTDVSLSVQFDQFQQEKVDPSIVEEKVEEEPKPVTAPVLNTFTPGISTSMPSIPLPLGMPFFPGLPSTGIPSFVPGMPTFTNTRVPVVKPLKIEPFQLVFQDILSMVFDD